MARRVLIHIGVPKSGTTFLQTTMWRNRAELRSQGLLYPGRGRLDHYHASREVRGVGRKRMGPHAGAWDGLVERLQAWEGDGLISHEFFSMASRRQARAAVAALAPAEVHVVLTARDYQRQLPAVWQEGLKMSSEESFDDFMHRMLAVDGATQGSPVRGAWGWRSQDLPEVLGRWSAAVPRSRVHLVTVPPASAPRDLLWRRWCELIGIDSSELDLRGSSPNESLGAAQAALLRRVKPWLTAPLGDGGATQHRWVRQYFGHEVLVPQRGDRFTMRPEQAAALRERSLRAVDTLAAAGYDVVGDLADLVPDPAPPGGPHPDEVTDSELVEVAARALDRMIHDVRTLTLERDRWRGEAERGAGPSSALAGRVTRALRVPLRRGAAVVRRMR